MLIAVWEPLDYGDNLNEQEQQTINTFYIGFVKCHSTK